MQQLNGEGDGLARPPRLDGMVPTTGTASAPKGSPEWWRDRLERKLEARRDHLKLVEDYYEGRHRLAFATAQFRQAFGRTFREFADNFMQIVVDAVDERLRVEGFRIPTGEGDDPENALALLKGDAQAWEMWQANGLDSGSQLVHTDALVDGESYVIVGPGGDVPEITGESALQVITESQAGYRARRLAGLKKWRDDDGQTFATLYRPDYVYKWIASERSSIDGVVTRWARRPVVGEPWPLPNTLEVVPVVPFCNRPRLMIEGRSEIAQLIPLQDAINKLFMDMLVASEYAGFPQRVATGIELPVDPETNQAIDALKMALDRFIHTKNDNAKFATLEPAELSNYTGAIAMEIQHLATRSSTPPHYFLANMGNFPSGEALKAAETGLVSKVRRRMRGFGESWEEVIRLGFLATGNTPKAQAALGGEVIWGDPESRSESEHIDALSKLAAMKVPVEVLWEKSGMFSPQEIERMKALLAAGAPIVEASPAIRVEGGGTGGAMPATMQPGGAGPSA